MGKYITGKRFHRQSDGFFHDKAGKKYQELLGSRQQVGRGTRYKTAGGLLQSDLHFTGGRWKSKSKIESATKDNRLVKHGYGSRKGRFGVVRLQ